MNDRSAKCMTDSLSSLGTVAMGTADPLIVVVGFVPIAAIERFDLQRLRSSREKTESEENTLTRR